MLRRASCSFPPALHTDPEPCPPDEPPQAPRQTWHSAPEDNKVPPHEEAISRVLPPHHRKSQRAQPTEPDEDRILKTPSSSRPAFPQSPGILPDSSRIPCEGRNSASADSDEVRGSAPVRRPKETPHTLLPPAWPPFSFQTLPVKTVCPFSPPAA